MANSVSIGRDASNDICLSEAFLSSKHAEITLEDPTSLKFRLRDLGSTNGTFLNGKRITEAEFELSDTIMLANRRLAVDEFLPKLLGSVTRSSKTAAASRSKPQSFRLLLLIGAVLAGLASAGLLLLSGQQINGQAISGQNLILASLGIAVLSTGIMVVGDNLRRTFVRARAERQYLDLRLRALADEIEQKTQRKTKQTEHNKGWEGFRKFQLARRTDEANGITSFYLVPHDGKALAPYAPGQYLTLRLQIPGQPKPVVRCYSLSDCFRDGHYRISVKRARGSKPGEPDGLVSGYLHEQAQVGELLDVKAPSGSFHLDESSSRPVVLLAGGVGITPMLAMFNSVLASGRRREVKLFYAARAADEFVRISELAEADLHSDHISVHFFCSSPDEQGRLPRQSVQFERLSVEQLKKILPSNNYEFYLCGPGPFMSALVGDLRSWGVPDGDIHFEAFGPSTVATKPAAGAAEPVATAAVTVTFARSKKTMRWSASDGSLLEACERNGIALDSGCRAGNCGTCQVALVSGKVSYSSQHDVTPESGSCLACIATPDSDITVDA
ncbi:FHA domain-containing protein [Permianibacter sp. IMCC34836]|uniref:FHA domain-containing protein n=1 Tax=Permianibacter fluminis TaxID=2738515 RepID=UPI001551BA4F|nr:FHA domain-containing protein [Permianibacter fluminis]NQD35768.1 FHA domain-containing protein [Permianibacter fluminis]